MSDDALTFDAVVAKVQTLVDNGIRVTLDLPETAIEAAAVLMGVKRNGLAIMVNVTIAPCKTGQEQGHGNEFDKLAKRPKRQSQRTGRKGPDTSRPTE